MTWDDEAAARATPGAEGEWPRNERRPRTLAAVVPAAGWLKRCSGRVWFYTGPGEGYVRDRVGVFVSEHLD